ncbi:MAG: response regulator transcription factor [Phycisphaerales bacterium]|nr:response regulator transcription factor [Phycisphaerales bacterium]
MRRLLTVPQRVARTPRHSADSAKATRASAKGPAQRVVPDLAPTVPSGRDVGIRVLCVDDHAVLVEGLKAKFAVDGRIRVVGSLATAERLLEETARLQPDIVLLDIEMPGPDIFEVADRLRRAHPKLRFVFLSAHIRGGYLAAAYKCGAWGYFAKGDQLDDIVAGLREVASSSGGTFVMGPKVRAHCRPATMRAAGGLRRRAEAADLGAGPATPLASLSSREIEVLRLIGKGLTRVQIATELSRSAKTIDRHQDRMMKKLGVSNRAELIRLAIREGFAEA